MTVVLDIEIILIFNARNCFAYVYLLVNNNFFEIFRALAIWLRLFTCCLVCIPQRICSITDKEVSGIML